ncbi:unnamed protein product [Cuscuta epithymum]|uniref:Uncharacterized protein n=1 Tax=Cuscuta epithymum TaxID=186058 RepID=A0AAV0CYV5_9ASTE|nr:unnamed protein product [Cuscuta epithymum]
MSSLHPAIPLQNATYQQNPCLDNPFVACTIWNHANSNLFTKVYSPYANSYQNLAAISNQAGRKTGPELQTIVAFHPKGKAVDSIHCDAQDAVALSHTPAAFVLRA